MKSIRNLGSPVVGHACMAITEALIQRLIDKGVLSEDEVRAMFSEVADMLSESPIAMDQVAGSGIKAALTT